VFILQLKRSIGSGDCDQSLFFVAVTFILMADSKEELASICETIETIGNVIHAPLILII